MRAALTFVLCLCVTTTFAQDKKSEKRTTLVDKTPDGEVMKAVNRSPRLAAATLKLNADVARAAKAYHRERAKHLDLYLKTVELELNDALAKKNLDEANVLDQLKKRVESMIGDSDAPPPPHVNNPPTLPIATPERVAVPVEPAKTETPTETIPVFVRPKAPELSPYEVLPLVQQAHMRNSTWTRKEDGLYATGSDYDLFHVPVAATGEYDVTAKVTRLDDSTSYICFIVPYGEKGVWMIYDWDRNRSGVDNVGKYVKTEDVLPQGKERTLTLKIRANSAKGYLDGKELFGWTGTPKEAFNPRPEYAGRAAIQVATTAKSQWKITSLEVKPATKE